MMLFYKTLDQYNESGTIGLVYSIRDAIPFAFEGVLLALFIIIFGAQYFFSKNRTGRAKILVAFVSSSFMIMILSLFLVLSNLVDFRVTIFYAFLLIISFTLLLLSDNS